jgi:hypothetical protein
LQLPLLPVASHPVQREQLLRDLIDGTGAWLVGPSAGTGDESIEVDDLLFAFELMGRSI